MITRRIEPLHGEDPVPLDKRKRSGNYNRNNRNLSKYQYDSPKNIEDKIISLNPPSNTTVYARAMRRVSSSLHSELSDEDNLSYRCGVERLSHDVPFDDLSDLSISDGVLDHFPSPPRQYRTKDRHDGDRRNRHHSAPTRERGQVQQGQGQIQTTFLFET